MKFLGQKEENLYAFLIKYEELGALYYTFTFMLHGVVNMKTSKVVREFELKNDIPRGLTWNLYSEKIMPFIEKEQAFIIALTRDELFVLNYFLFHNTFQLGIDCDSLSGTSREEVYSMIYIFLQIMQSISFDNISDGAKESRHSSIAQIQKYMDKNRASFIEHDSYLVEKYGLPRFQERRKCNSVDLSQFAKYSVEINLTGNRIWDKKAAMESLGINENDYDRAKWVWHYCRDGKTMQLVPRSVHEIHRHMGGSPEVKAGILTVDDLKKRILSGNS